MRRNWFIIIILVAIVSVITSCGRKLPEATEIAQTSINNQAEAEPTATESVTEESIATEEATEAATEAAATEEGAATAVTDEAEVTEVATDDATESVSDAGEVALVGDPAAGEQLFNQFITDVAFACSTCHHANSEERLIGPGLQHVGERAATRVEGQSAIEYLHDSIVNPSAHVVTDYPDQLMPQTYGQIFSEDQLNDLIAYLMSL